jgi:hypothetical protein
VVENLKYGYAGLTTLVERGSKAEPKDDGRYAEKPHPFPRKGWATLTSKTE